METDTKFAKTIFHVCCSTTNIFLVRHRNPKVQFVIPSDIEVQANTFSMLSIIVREKTWFLILKNMQNEVNKIETEKQQGFFSFSKSTLFYHV